MVTYAKETTKASRWGNSLGVRLPARSAARAGISHNTVLTVESGTDVITLRPVRTLKKPHTLKGLLKHVRPRRDREARKWLATKPIGREVW